MLHGTFYATADAATALAASYGAPQANRNDFYFSATPDGRRQNRPIRAANYAQPMAAALRKVSVAAVRAAAVRCVGLR